MTCTIVTAGEELLLKCKNEHEPPYPELKAKLRELIWRLYCYGYTDFFVNCEYGIPLWSAETICALKLYNDIRLHIAVPYEEQTTEWSEEKRDRYFKVHELADSIKLMNTHYHPDCFYEAEKYMTDESDLLLLIGKQGSCSDLFHYAENKNIHAEYYSIL